MNLPLLALLLGTVALSAPGPDRPVLYDRTENLPLERQALKRGQGFPAPNTTLQERQSLARLLEPSFARAYRGREYFACDSLSVQDHFSRPDVLEAAYKVSGSFTRAGARQTVWVYTLCSRDGAEYAAGLALTEGGRLLANFSGKHLASEAYSVRDLNQNGLNELLLAAPDPQEPQGSGRNTVQLYEFQQGQLRGLGRLPVGGPSPLNLLGDSSPTSAYPMGIFGPVSTCEAIRDQGPEILTQVITVQKGRIPKFFSTPYRVNCSYREVGLKLKPAGKTREVNLLPFRMPFIALPPS